MDILKSLSKQANASRILLYILIGLGLALLMLYKLGSLVDGVSLSEVSSSTQAVGWHGIYHNPLFLPLNILRSIDFAIFKTHGAFLTRLPNALFGALTIASFGVLSYLWHGKRTAYFATIMFTCSAWVLHVSRLASFDVLYLWASTTALLGYALVSKFKDNKYICYFNLFFLGILITIPGMLWLSLVMLFFERKLILQQLNTIPRKFIAAILLILWIPLTLIRSASTHHLKQWVGLPNHFPSILHLIKDFVAVPFHLLVRGPETSIVWLGKSPTLDAFSLAMLLLGVYFYGRRYDNGRSRLIGGLLILSIILIGLDGSVSFSLIMPIAYLLIAMGLSYVMHIWKKVFPKNPIAKWLSLSIIILAIAISCAYNLRSYFIAWPHNPVTYSTFDRLI